MDTFAAFEQHAQTWREITARREQQDRDTAAREEKLSTDRALERAEKMKAAEDRFRLEKEKLQAELDQRSRALKTEQDLEMAALQKKHAEQTAALLQKVATQMTELDRERQLQLSDAEKIAEETKEEGTARKENIQALQKEREAEDLAVKEKMFELLREQAGRIRKAPQTPSPPRSQLPATVSEQLTPTAPSKKRRRNDIQALLEDTDVSVASPSRVSRSAAKRIRSSGTPQNSFLISVALPAITPDYETPPQDTTEFQDALSIWQSIPTPTKSFEINSIKFLQRPLHRNDNWDCLEGQPKMLMQANEKNQTIEPVLEGINMSLVHPNWVVNKSYDLECWFDERNDPYFRILRKNMDDLTIVFSTLNDLHGFLKSYSAFGGHLAVAGSNLKGEWVALRELAAMQTVE